MAGAIWQELTYKQICETTRPCLLNTKTNQKTLLNFVESLNQEQKCDKIQINCNFILA